MPHGPGVLALSRKSRSYFLAGGNVRATWARVSVHWVANPNKSRNTARITNLIVILSSAIFSHLFVISNNYSRLPPIIRYMNKLSSANQLTFVTLRQVRFMGIVSLFSSMMISFKKNGQVFYEPGTKQIFFLVKN